MAHVRQTIRERAATAITGLASSAPVYQSRVNPVEADQLPALLVYTTEESVDADSMPLGSHEGTRTLILQVDALSRLATGMDDQLDTLCAEVETALQTAIDASGAGTLGELLKWGELTATAIELLDGAERDTGRASMTWLLQYRTDTSDPTTVVA